jgi:hypothetical protein
MLVGLRKLGVLVPARASAAVMHLWKGIAWQMGVQLPWLVDTERQGLLLLRHCALTHGPPDETSWRLTAALAEEPLQRNYAFLPSLRRQWAYYFHLSSSAWLIGPPFFRQLRLRSPTGPWLRLMHLPFSAALYYLGYLLPGREKRGRNAQKQATAELHTG